MTTGQLSRSYNVCVLGRKKEWRKQGRSQRLEVSMDPCIFFYNLETFNPGNFRQGKIEGLWVR